jgi:hypothetical protein
VKKNRKADEMPISESTPSKKGYPILSMAVPVKATARPLMRK